ncbi:MAG: hypothetical protein ACLQOO_24210 [Terriglobia bacterium]
MAVKGRDSSKSFSPVSELAGWARQGVESFVAAQKILLDVTARQNALVIGMARERLSKARSRPGATIAKVADKGVENFTAAGKILLGLAAGEITLVADGVKEGMRLPEVAGTVADVARHRVDTLIDMQKRLLDAAAEQTHALAESYREGKGLRPGASVARLARRAIEGFVEAEQKFLDLAAHEVTAATKAGKQGRKPAEDRSKVLTQLAREGVEKYIDAQKKVLHLAVEQMEFTSQATGERLEAALKEARASWDEVTVRSMWNLVMARKSLMDLPIKPVKAPPTEETRETPRARPRAKKQPVGAHDAT